MLDMAISYLTEMRPRTAVLLENILVFLLFISIVVCAFMNKHMNRYGDLTHPWGAGGRKSA